MTPNGTATRDAAIARNDATTLTVEHLSIEVLTDRGWTPAVEDVSFEIGTGKTLGLVGESGSGKTLTSLAVTGLLDPRSVRVSSGRVRVGEAELTSLDERQLQDIRGRCVSMIFQEPMTSLNPAFTIGEQIAESARRHLGMSRRTAWKRAIEMLDAVKIPNAARRAKAYPHEFSGGMRQRAMIALALVCRPDLLVADEPTTALDVTVQAQIIQLIAELQEEFGMSILFVTHDLSVIATVADDVVVMYAGQVVERADVYQLFDDPQHPYSRGLLRSNPTGSHGSDVLYSIPGRPPPVGAFSEHCRFASRCPEVIDACRVGAVPLVPTTDTRHVRCVRVDATSRTAEGPT